MMQWVAGSIFHGTLIYLFLVPASDPRNKDRDMGYSVYRVVHIKYPVLLIEKSSQCSDSSRFPLFLYSDRLTYARRKEGNVLFNDALNTFYLRLYGVRHGNGQLRYERKPAAATWATLSD